MWSVGFIIYTQDLGNRHLQKHSLGVYLERVIYMDIREMRTQLGDTQSEFSARYGIPFRTVPNWEAGVRAALKKQMQDLASTLPEYPVVMQMYGVGIGRAHV